MPTKRESENVEESRQWWQPCSPNRLTPIAKDLVALPFFGCLWTTQPTEPTSSAWDAAIWFMHRCKTIQMTHLFSTLLVGPLLVSMIFPRNQAVVIEAISLKLVIFARVRSFKCGIVIAVRRSEMAKDGGVHLVMSQSAFDVSPIQSSLDSSRHAFLAAICFLIVLREYWIKKVTQKIFWSVAYNELRYRWIDIKFCGWLIVFGVDIEPFFLSLPMKGLGCQLWWDQIDGDAGCLRIKPTQAESQKTDRWTNQQAKLIECRRVMERNMEDGSCWWSNGITSGKRYPGSEVLSSSHRWRLLFVILRSRNSDEIRWKKKKGVIKNSGR